MNRPPQKERIWITDQCYNDFDPTLTPLIVSDMRKWLLGVDIDRVEEASLAASSTLSGGSIVKTKKNQVNRKKGKMHGKTGNYCTGCDDELEEDENIVLLHKTRRQSHGLCTDCMSSYLRSQFQDRVMQLSPSTKISCCGNIQSKQSNKCTYELELLEGNLKSGEENLRRSLVKFISGNKQLEKLYMRIIALNLPGAVICIKCSEVVTDIPEDQNDLTCPYCCTSWCRICKTVPYHHGQYCPRDGALANMYVGAGGEELRQKIESGVYKLCPRCNQITDKIDGCNKMTCVTCQSKWCWLCNAVDIDYGHFGDNGPNSCRQKLWYATGEVDDPLVNNNIDSDDDSYSDDDSDSDDESDNDDDPLWAM